MNMASPLGTILTTWLAAGDLTPSDWNQLQAASLADSKRDCGLSGTADHPEQALQNRAYWFPQVAAASLQYCQARGFASSPVLLETLWQVWLPLAMQLVSDRQSLERPLIQGILGGQGTGKSTLAGILGVILGRMGYRSLGLSLDDLYKSYGARLQLQEQDPRLIWRGPPGTHDVERGVQLLAQLRRPDRDRQSLWVPRFDKSAHGGLGDQGEPEAVAGIDIVLFEGWFVGVRPVDPQAFATPPDPIVTEGDRTFARDMNHQLQAYLPLWDRLDRLMVLIPSDYRYSLQWRQQAEQQQRAQGKPGMSDREIESFVTYFWQALHPDLFICPLTQDPERVNLVLELDQHHQIRQVYRPGSQ